MSDKAFLIQYHKLNAADYQNAWDFQTLLHDEIKSRKSPKNPSIYNKINTFSLNHLIFCEHRPVITMGKSGKEFNLVASPEQLKKRGIDFYRINRGGDITYHGPGQITGYLIFDLERLYRDVHLFVRNIEECIIRFLAQYGLEGSRIPDYTGVWINDGGGQRKICAIGVHLSRWVSMHGFALNINTELGQYRHIIPCGINEEGKSVTSIEKEAGKKIDMNEACEKLRDIIVDLFDGDLV